MASLQPNASANHSKTMSAAEPHHLWRNHCHLRQRLPRVGLNLDKIGSRPLFARRHVGSQRTTKKLGDQLGDSVVSLFEHLLPDKHKNREAFLPEAARDTINGAMSQTLPDSYFFFAEKHARLPSVDLGDKIDITAEQRQLSRIIAEAQVSASRGCAGATWNIKVRGPLLALALRTFSNSSYERLRPEGLKMSRYADPRSLHHRIRKPMQLEQDGGKATFALVPDSPCLAKNVRERLSKLKVSDRQVNHLLYKSLRHLPLACLVETGARTVYSVIASTNGVLRLASTCPRSLSAWTGT